MSDELQGHKRYARLSPEGEKKEPFRQSQMELDQFLNEQGIDLKTASNADVKTALEAHFKSGTYQQTDEPSVVLKGDELGAYSTPKEMVAAARKTLEDLRVSGPVTNPELGEIHINNSGIGKTMSRIGPEKASLLPGLRQILERGKLVETQEPHHADGNIKAFHILETRVRIGDRDVTARTIVREDSKSRLYYDIRGGGASEFFQKSRGDASSDSPPGITQSDEAPTSPKQIAVTADRLIGDVARNSDDINLNLAQAAPVGGARGSITLGDGQTIIKAFKSANKSTMLHEFGHLFLHQLLGDADRADAPDHLVADATAVRKWLGVSPGEYPIEAQHEKWARGFETYLMDGKAPSVELRSAFQKFGAWLTRIYRTALGIGVPINDEIRGVMDRLLASDEAIAEAKLATAWVNALGRTKPEDTLVTRAFSGRLGRSVATPYATGRLHPGCSKTGSVSGTARVDAGHAGPSNKKQ